MEWPCANCKIDCPGTTGCGKWLAWMKGEND